MKGVSPDMMNSDEKSIVPALLRYIRSDLFSFGNISSNVKLTIPSETSIVKDNTIIETSSSDPSISWETVVSYLPLEFYHIIESYPDMVVVEEFDKRYIRNPKMCAYEKYGSTNMWRPLMILNRCPTIAQFNFDKFIRYYNITTFSNLLSVLISRVQQNDD
jgi:hypothetical protein